MEHKDLSLKEYIDSGEYFSDAIKWYNHKYLNPLKQKSIVLLALFISLIILSVSAWNIYNILPISQQVNFFTEGDIDTRGNTAHISPLNDTINLSETLKNTMIKNYILKRESYNYNKLETQFECIKNTSAQNVFDRFNNFMKLDNPVSPILIYGKNIIRTISIISTDYHQNNIAKIKFNSLAYKNELIENIIWEATIKYEIDKIHKNFKKGSKINFIVMDYQLQMIENKLSINQLPK